VERREERLFFFAARLTHGIAAKPSHKELIVPLGAAVQSAK
jgi:hypothetical protein